MPYQRWPSARPAAAASAPTPAALPWQRRIGSLLIGHEEQEIQSCGHI